MRVHKRCTWILADESSRCCACDGRIEEVLATLSLKEVFVYTSLSKRSSFLRPHTHTPQQMPSHWTSKSQSIVLTVNITSIALIASLYSSAPRFLTAHSSSSDEPRTSTRALGVFEVKSHPPLNHPSPSTFIDYTLQASIGCEIRWLHTFSTSNARLLRIRTEVIPSAN